MQNNNNLLFFGICNIVQLNLVLNMEKKFEQELELIESDNTMFYVYNRSKNNIGTKWHSHKHCVQFVYSEGGVIIIKTETAQWYLPAKHFMIIPPNIPHSIHSTSRKVDIYNLYFRIDSNDHIFYQKMQIYAICPLLREMVVFTKHWKERIGLEDTLKFNYFSVIKGLLPNAKNNELLFPAQTYFPTNERLIKMTEYVKENLDKKISMRDAALFIGMSEKTMSRAIMKDLGISYIRYVISLRIITAIELMQENKYNINQIAALVGYDSLSTFIKNFKKIIGTTPKEYELSKKKMVVKKIDI